MSLSLDCAVRKRVLTAMLLLLVSATVVPADSACSVLRVESVDLDLAPLGGFVEICSRDAELCSVVTRGYPPSVTTLGYFVLEEEWISYSESKQVEFTVYLIAQMGQAPMSAEEFGEFKQYVSSRGGAIPDNTELPSILEKRGQVSLGVLDTTDDSITFGTVMKAQTLPSLGSHDLSLAATNTALQLKEHTLSLYVYRSYSGPSDVEKLQATTGRWLACLRDRNGQRGPTGGAGSDSSAP